jgi:beta-glucosidase-like glycosyl hydrolase
MAAHVIYECFDCTTAVFSNRWIDYLRNNIKFNGVVFTDDLSMAGAGVVGDMLARVQTAYGAGCDMLLVCNSPDSVALVLENWHPEIDPVRRQRVERLAANAGQDIVFAPDRLLAAQRWLARCLPLRPESGPRLARSNHWQIIPEFSSTSRLGCRRLRNPSTWQA